jgi:very-short-patch-repair endonuclease
MHSQVLAVVSDSVEYRIDKTMALVAGKIESPIEQIFLETVILIHLLCSNGAPPIDNWDTKTARPLFGVKTQYKVNGYRADFLLVSNTGQSVLIECDGHDFHERTKEQAARDRKKDRDLQAAGYVVLRYTGSELWNDPMKCAGDAVAKLLTSSSRVAPKEGFDLLKWFDEPAIEATA